MKPKGSEMQGGGAATTDPRKPDYANLFPMFDTDWDDPSVAELARRRNRHPVEIIIDLCLENDNRVFVQPLVNELPEDVLGLLKHPRTLATFSDSGAHVCQEMGSSLQTHLLSYWVRKRQQFTLEEAVRMLTFDNASAWELPDRGLIRTGYAADIVVFDEARSARCFRKSSRICRAAPAVWCRRPTASPPQSLTAPSLSRTARRPGTMPGRCSRGGWQPRCSRVAVRRCPRT